MARRAESESSLPGSEHITLIGAAADVSEKTRRHLGQILDLFTLEVRYSGLMFAWVIAMALIVALGVFSVWGLLVAAAVSWLLSLGWGWPSALAALAVTNGLCIVLALWFASSALTRIGLTNTRDALGLGGSVGAE